MSDFDATRLRFASRSRAVGVRPSSSPSSLQLREQLLPADEPPRRQPRRPLGGVPRAEVLDHRLRMHLRLGVGGELAHRRRAAEPLCARPELLEDLLVGVAPPDPGTELGEGSLVDPGDSRMAAPGPGHCNYSRAICEKCKIGPEQAESTAGLPVGSIAMGMRLAAETSAARLVGRLSRAVGRGGGTTLPGKLLWKVDPGALDALAARLPDGVAIVSATNGKTTTSAMLARILGGRHRLAWNNSGANLASGVASTLLSAPDADLGLLEVDEFALPEMMRRVRPRVVSLGNLFRDQLDRYGELEHIAERWRSAAAALPPSSTLVVNADDPLVAAARGADARARSGSASTTRASRARRSSTRPTRSTASAAGRPTTTRPPTSAISATTAVRPAATRRPPLDVAARAIELDGLDGSTFDLVTPAGTERLRLPLPGLYNVYNALAAATTALALETPLDEIRAGLESFTAAFGRFERIDGGRADDPDAADQEPGRRQRGDPHARGGRRAGDARDRASTTRSPTGATSPGSGTSTSSRCSMPLERIVVTGERAAELALRFTYARLRPRRGSR